MIDKIHGIEPILRKGDVKLAIQSRKPIHTEESQEYQETKASALYKLQSRIDSLIACQESRHLEFLAIHEQLEALERESQSRLYEFQRRMHEKTYEACYKKFENIQKSIMETVNQDLEILKS